MIKKIFNIPIEAPEDVALQFIELICKACMFNPLRIDEEGNEYTLEGQELHQAKLNFVGSIAGIYLRQIAENEALNQENERARLEREERNRQVASLFVVKPVEVVEVAND